MDVIPKEVYLQNMKKRCSKDPVSKCQKERGSYSNLNLFCNKTLCNVFLLENVPMQTANVPWENGKLCRQLLRVGLSECSVILNIPKAVMETFQ